MLELQARRQGLKEGAGEGGDAGAGDREARVGLGASVHYDQEIYGSASGKFAGYVTSIAPNEEQDVSSTLYFKIV